MPPFHQGFQVPDESITVGLAVVWSVVAAVPTSYSFPATARMKEPEQTVVEMVGNGLF